MLPNLTHVFLFEICCLSPDKGALLLLDGPKCRQTQGTNFGKMDGYNQKSVAPALFVRCPTDLEILGYNLVHWMSGSLPWMDNLANEEYVEAQKKGFMTDIKSFLERCFEDREYPGEDELLLGHQIYLD